MIESCGETSSARITLPSTQHHHHYFPPVYSCRMVAELVFEANISLHWVTRQSLDALRKHSYDTAFKRAIFIPAEWLFAYTHTNACLPKATAQYFLNILLSLRGHYDSRNPLSTNILARFACKSRRDFIRS